MSKALEFRRLTEEENRLVEENKAFVHHIVRTAFRVFPNSPYYDDMVSIGTMGLMKAARSFDKREKVKFITYASICIKNEIRMDYRKNKKHLQNIYMEDIIREYKDGIKITLEDEIEDTKANFVEKILEKEKIAEIMNVILNWLNPKSTIIILYYIIEKTQTEIAEILHIDQSYISRIQRNSIKKIQYVINSNMRYKKTFSITIEGNKYQIKFPLGRIGDVNEILPKILSEIDLKGLSITHDSNEVTIMMLEGLEEIFIFIQIYDALYKNYPNFFDEIIKYNNKRLRGI